MPTDAEGNFTLPPGTIVQVDDYITPSQHNPAMTDIAAGLTGRLARNGAGGMLANLNMNGRKIVNAGPATDPTDVMTLGQAALFAGVPIGAMVDFAGEFPPAGWIFADGRSLAVNDEPAAFAVLGYRWGGAGANFMVPDTRGRVTAGLDMTVGGSYANRLTTPDSRVLGASGGAETVTLTEAQMPTHKHDATTAGAGGHFHFIASTNYGTGGADAARVIGREGDTGGRFSYTLFGATGAATIGRTSPEANHTHSVTVSDVGGGQAHPNVQPVIIAAKIIKIRN